MSEQSLYKIYKHQILKNLGIKTYPLFLTRKEWNSFESLKVIDTKNMEKRFLDPYNVLLLIFLENESTTFSDIVPYLVEREYLLDLYSSQCYFQLLNCFESIIRRFLIMRDENDLIVQSIEWLLYLKSKRNLSLNPLTLQVLYNKFSIFWWKKLEEIHNNATGKHFLDAGRILKAVKNLEIDISDFAVVFTYYALEFIEERNFPTMIPNIPKDIQQDYLITDDLMEIIGTYGEIKLKIDEIRGKLETIEPRYKVPVIYDQVEIGNLETDYEIVFSNKSVVIYKSKTIKKVIKAYEINEYYQYKIDKIINEIEIYTRLSEKAAPENCFIKFDGFNRTETKIYLKMEYFNYSLQTLLDSKINWNEYFQQIFDDEKLKEIFRRLLSSFADMATLGIYHQDIKPANLLCDEQEYLKIIDFNSSRSRINKVNYESKIGTQGYMAPERVEELENIDIEKADVFSLGMVFFRMIIYVQEWPRLNLKENNNNLLNHVRKIKNILYKGLLTAMLNENPAERKSFRNLLSFFETGPTNTYA